MLLLGRFDPRGFRREAMDVPSTTGGRARILAWTAPVAAACEARRLSGLPAPLLVGLFPGLSVGVLAGLLGDEPALLVPAWAAAFGMALVAAPCVLRAGELAA